MIGLTIGSSKRPHHGTWKLREKNRYTFSKDGNILGLPQPPAPAPGAMGVVDDSTVFRGHDMEVYIHADMYLCLCWDGVIQNSATPEIE